MTVERSVGLDAYVELEQFINAALRWWISVGEALLGVGGECFDRVAALEVHITLAATDMPFARFNDMYIIASITVRQNIAMPNGVHAKTTKADTTGGNVVCPTRLRVLPKICVMVCGTSVGAAAA